MKAYALSHLTDQVLLQDLATLVARDRTHTADLIGHIAEVDRRKLYLPAAHPSMFSYCMNVLHLSEQATYKRVRVARMARRFPVIYGALAEGCVHLSGLVMLKPFLTRGTVDELLAAATHKSSREIKKLLRERFPQADVPTQVRALPRHHVAAPCMQLSPRTVATASPGSVKESSALRTDECRTEEHLSPKAVEVPSKPAKVEPLGLKRYSLQLSMSQVMHDKLRHAQALLSHQLPSGDVTNVLERALDALIAKLEKSKFAATDRPRAAQARTSANPRHIPSHVKRVVRERDGDQCTFVSETGPRCPERHFLEFDHVDPVSRGGEATADRMRLRCRAHNQYEAERMFGVPFMQRKLHEAGKRREVHEYETLEQGAAQTRRAP